MSSSVIINKELEEKVEELENKSQRIRDSKDTEDRVDSASRNVNRICGRLTDVSDKANELKFYVRIYEEVFDQTRPGSLQPLVRNAITRVNIKDEELITAAQEQRLSELEDQVEESEESIQKGIKQVQENIKEEQQDWEGNLESAEELNKIIGSDSSFQTLINNMRRFLNQDVWNPSKSASNLEIKWRGYEDQWRENSEKHGWETFQGEHDLADKTIDELKQFTKDDPVRLSDLSLETLKEIKNVPELESALQLEVRSKGRVSR